MSWMSASQIETWRDCRRKWGFRWLDKVQVPQSKSRLLGIEVQDEQVDPYLMTGKPVDFSKPSGEIAHEVLKLMPAPKAKGMVLRRKLTFPSPSGQFTYFSELDIWATDSKIVPGLPGGLPLVGDLKTCGSFDYALSADGLRGDVQASLYSIGSAFEDGNDRLDLVWWYAKTRKPHRAQRVHLRVAADDLVETFGKADETGVAIMRDRAAFERAADLPPNVLACDHYGGCPHRGICNHGPAMVASGLALNEAKEGGQMDFLKELQERAAKRDGSVPIESVTAAQVESVIAKALEAPPAMSVQVNPPEQAIAHEAEPTSKKKGGKVASSVTASGSGFPAADLATFFRKLADWVEGK